MESKTTPTQKLVLPLKTALRLTSSLIRLRILDFLMKHEAIAFVDLSDQLGVPRANLSKHLQEMLRVGVLEQRYGRTYSLRPGFQVPGERVLDFGGVLIRLDWLDRK